MQEIIIANQKIGPSQPPFVVAEMSGNHNQSLDRAMAIVDAAASQALIGPQALKQLEEALALVGLCVAHLDPPEQLEATGVDCSIQVMGFALVPVCMAGTFGIVQF